MWPSLASPSLGPEAVRQLRSQVRHAASRYLVMPWTLPQLLGDTRPSGVVITRACWTVEISQPTTRTGACSKCRGGRAVCPDCGASERVRCHECGGAGEVPGKRKLKKKCPSCRGKGDRKCHGCKKGTVECPDCLGSGRGPAQIELVTRREGRVQVEAEGDPRAWHPPLREVADFDRAAGQRESLTSVELLADTGWQIDAPPWRGSDRLALQLGANERVLGVRVQQLRARVLTTTLRTRWRTSELSFVGRPPQLVKPDLGPLRQRAQLAGVGAGVVALLGLWLTSQYRGRSPWFIEYGPWPSLALLALLAGSLIGLLILGLSLPERARWRWLAPVVGLAVVLVAGAGLWWSAAPSLVVAEQAFDQGDLERAEFELDAMVALERGSPELATLRDQIANERGVRADDERLRQLSAATSLEGAGVVLREAWFDPARREPKLDEHLAGARAALEAGWGSHDARGLVAVMVAVEGLDAELADEANALARLVGIRAAIEAGDLQLAVERFADVPRLDAVVERREVVEAELRAALELAAREQHTLGFDKQLELRERVEALDRFVALEGWYRALTGAALEGLELERARAQREKLTEQIAVEEARAERAEARRIAAEQRRAKKAARSSSRSSSSGGGGSGSGSGSGGYCCKTCSNSKPCGDSCISRSKTCHKGRGCAC